VAQFFWSEDRREREHVSARFAAHGTRDRRRGRAWATAYIGWYAVAFGVLLLVGVGAGIAFLPAQVVGLLLAHPTGDAILKRVRPDVPGAEKPPPDAQPAA
jgi:hypothetical protein